MDWLEITLDTRHEDIDPLCERLESLGVSGIVINDEATVTDFLEKGKKYWDYVDDEVMDRVRGVCSLQFYLEDSDDGRSELERISAALDGTELRTRHVRDEDWENNWKQYYQPIPIGEKLIVVPKWMKPETAGRIPVLLDPGMIFGTGAHASTQMCMLRLEEHIRGGETVLDLGSGSGILSITALLLGAAHATGVDVDPKAEDIARENAAINALGADRFTAVTGNVITGQDALADLFAKTYDVICMNIFADVIIPMAAVLPRFMRADTVVICSGVLENRYAEVRAAIEAAGLRIETLQTMNDWCCFTAVKGD